jgi:hypothetical protein
MAQPQHRSRNAVIAMRQSTGQPGLTNPESHPLQHARRAPARPLGWPAARRAVVETALGRSAQSTAGRDGSQALRAAVALGQVGIGLRSASPRLARTCPAGSPWRDLGA